MVVTVSVMWTKRTPARAKLVSAVVAMLCLLVSADVASAHRGRSCQPRVTAATVARTHEAWVFSRRVHLSEAESDGAAGRRSVLFGCSDRSRHSYRLSQLGEFGLAEVDRRLLVLSGHFVAYVQGFASAAGGDNREVTVRSLATGRVVHRFSGSASNYDSSLRVFDLVLKRNGSAAWISEDEVADSRDRMENQVHLVDRSGRRQVLDRGPDIDPTSLTLSADRRTVSWTRAGELRSAPMR